MLLLKGDRKDLPLQFLSKMRKSVLIHLMEKPILRSRLWGRPNKKPILDGFNAPKRIAPISKKSDKFSDAKDKDSIAESIKPIQIGTLPKKDKD